MKILLTGYTGNLGKAVAKKLMAFKYDIRVLLHGASILREDVPKEIEYRWGFLLQKDLMRDMTEDVDVIIHSAWDGRGDEEVMKRNNLAGTENLLTAAMENQVKTFIYVSSVGVYGLDKALWGKTIDEANPLVSKEHSMNPYPWVKVLIERKCQQLAQDEGDHTGLAIVRPGLLYSESKAPAKKFLPSKKSAIVVGNGRNHLPYIHVDDVADMLQLIICKNAGGVYNCVPTNHLSVNSFLVNWGRYYGQKKLRLIHVPPSAFLLAQKAARFMKKKLGKDVFETDIRYPVVTGIRNIRYSNTNAQRVLGWVDSTTRMIASGDGVEER